MSYIDIRLGAYIDYQGTRCKFERRQDHRTEWRSTTTFEHFLFTDAELNKEIRRGNLKLHGADTGPSGEHKAASLHGRRRATKADEIEAERRLHYVLAMHRKGLMRPDATQRDWEAAIEEVYAEFGRTWRRLRGGKKGSPQPKLHFRSVQRWCANSGKKPTLRQLLPRHRFKGNYEDRLPTELRDLIAAAVDEHYLRRPPITIDSLRDMSRPVKTASNRV